MRGFIFRVNLATGFPIDFQREKGIDLQLLKQVLQPCHRSARGSGQEVIDVTSDLGEGKIMSL